MFSAATPVKKAHTRASAAVRRSQSRAASVLSQQRALTPPQPADGPTRRIVANVGGQLAETAVTADNDISLDTLESQGVFLKTETHTVSLYGAGLPGDVMQILSESDFYLNPYTAALDHNAGYACLIGRDKCYIWSLSRTASFSPTCYAFPVPSSSSLSLSATVFSPVPFVAFIPQGLGREPGFLLISTTGQICYWQSITASLSDSDKYSSATIQLVPGEVIRVLEKLSSTYYLVATSGARLYGLNLNPANTVQIISLSRSRGMLARVGGLFGGASADPRAGILALSAVDVGDEGSKRVHRKIYAVSDKAVQTWRIQEGVAEQFLNEVDVYDAILEALSSTVNTETSSSFGILPEILDAKAQGPEKLVLLVSYHGSLQQGVRSTGSRKQLSFALIVLTGSNVTSVRTLSFCQEADPRPLSTPQLILLSQDTSLALILFPHLVLICTVSAQTPFEESVHLRDSARNRLLGAGLLGSDSLTVLAANSGLIQLQMNLVVLARRTALMRKTDAESLPAQDLKNKLLRAVIFGDRAQNPLAFDLSLDPESDLVTAAESVSKDILASVSPHVPYAIDLRSHLADRSARLRILITFIQDSSLVQKLSKTSRHHLAWDGEKLACAMSLWHAQNARMGNEEDNVLELAVESLNLPSRTGDDLIRGFFRTQVTQLGLALEQFLPILQNRLLPSVSLADQVSVIYQVDQALSLTYKTVRRFRSESSNLYGISAESQICLSEPWSSRPRLLELLRLAIECTEQTIAERTREMGSAIDDEQMIDYGQERRLDDLNQAGAELQRDLKEYMAEMADYALAMHQERMAFLQSLGEEAAAMSELRGLLQVYVIFRAHVIQSLVRISRINIAFDLAERYRDFRSLVVLCHDTNLGSPVRVQFYIEKYKEDFAFELYRWYLENGQFHELVNQDNVYRDMLSMFLKTANVPRLAWLQDIATQDYEQAAAALLQEAAVETRLAEQKLMLSMGKLAKVATLTRSQLHASEMAQKALEAIDDRIDFVTSHERLLEYCLSVLGERDARQSPIEQARMCTQALCSKLPSGLMDLTMSLFERLLAGAALCSEDLIDLFTLKDNTSPEQKNDYSRALEIMLRDKTTPNGRLKLSLVTMWRRIYLRDDWRTLRQNAVKWSDEAVSRDLRTTALYATLVAVSTTGTDANLLLRPAQAFYENNVNQEQAIRARFSNNAAYSNLSIDALITEYDRENSAMISLVEGDQTRLEEFYDEIERLIKLDRKEETVDDEEMTTDR